MRTRADILTDTLALLNELLAERDYAGEIGEATTLLTDLGFESLDIVVMANTIQERYGQKFPFAEYFAQVGEREHPDITVGEWVDFVYTHQKN